MQESPVEGREAIPLRDDLELSLFDPELPVPTRVRVLLEASLLSSIMHCGVEALYIDSNCACE
jgi:hypothetical protein